MAMDVMQELPTKLCLNQVGMAEYAPLLLHGMKQGTLGGVVAGEEFAENPQMGSSMLQTTADEIIRGQRSRYTYQPNTLALVEAMKKIYPL